MTQITLNVTNDSLLPMLRKLFRAIDGVEIATPRRKSGIELALEDVALGRVHEWHGSTEDMIKTILAEE